MTDPRRRLVLLVSSLLVVLLTAGYLVSQWRQGQSEGATPALTPRALDAELFVRSTSDDDYGQVVYLPGAGRAGRVATTARRCDRIDVLPDRTMVCMRAQLSVLQRSRLSVIDADGRVLDSWQVPGVPSRVRFSPDGSLVASTTFVAGHSYLQSGFSTFTSIHRVGGDDEDLEDYTWMLEGEERRPVDRNFWGVTFVDDRTFYATVRSGDTTWLVRGDRKERTLTSLRTDAECPSLSPDGRYLVYKKRSDDDAAAWRLALLDLESGDERWLGEVRSVDDQVEWFDRRTILYGLYRDDDLGRSDVWRLDVAEGAEPELVVENASSPSAVGRLSVATRAASSWTP